jgi:hypothetical protein
MADPTTPIAARAEAATRNADAETRADVRSLIECLEQIDRYIAAAEAEGHQCYALAQTYDLLHGHANARSLIASQSKEKG